MHVSVEVLTHIHHDRFRQLVRKGRATSAQLLGTFMTPQRRAILVALLIDLEVRLTDAALEMADRIVGGSFTRGGNAKRRVFVATTRDVGRLMALFDRTIVRSAPPKMVRSTVSWRSTKPLAGTSRFGRVRT